MDRLVKQSVSIVYGSIDQTIDIDCLRIDRSITNGSINRLCFDLPYCSAVDDIIWLTNDLSDDPDGRAHHGGEHRSVVAPSSLPLHKGSPCYLLPQLISHLSNHPFRPVPWFNQLTVIDNPLVNYGSVLLVIWPLSNLMAKWYAKLTSWWIYVSSSLSVCCTTQQPVE